MEKFKKQLSLLLAIVMLFSVVAISAISAGADTNDPSMDDIFDDNYSTVTSSTEPSSSETEPSSSETEPSSSETEPSSSETVPSGTGDPEGDDDWKETSSTNPSESESTTKEPVKALAMPVLRTVKPASKTSVVITFDAVDTAEKYIVFRATNGSASFKSITTITVTTTGANKGAGVVTYTDKTAKGGAQYTYKIRAIRGDEYKDSNVATVSMMKFSDRSKIKTTPAKKAVTVKIAKKVKYADGYEVRYSTNKKFKKKLTSKKTAKATAKKVKIKKLKSGKTYYVKMRAYKIINGKMKYGKWSKAVKAKAK